MTDAEWIFEARAVLAQGDRILSALRERLGDDDPASPIIDSWLKDHKALCVEDV